MVEGSLTDDDVEVQIESRSSAYKGFLSILVYRLRHRRFDGSMIQAISREVLERGQSVCVLPYDPRTDKVLLTRQFLIGSMAAGHAARPLQVVAGMVDAGETDEESARRETKEEAGCLLKRLIRAQSFFPSPGGSSERVVAFCGEADLDHAGGLFGAAQEDEDIRSEIFSADEAIALLDAGRVESATAVVILSWLARHRERLRSEWLRA